MSARPTYLIHLDWQGPIPWKERDKLNDEVKDYGIYQIYGCHANYGVDTLLYIGKAEKQTFATRLKQETGWMFDQDRERLSIYVGRCYGWHGTPSVKVWEEQINLAEKLLILAHQPTYNSQKGSWRNPKLQHVHVLNWGCHRSLFPEVSGWRQGCKFDNEKKYKAFEYHGK